MKEASTLVAYTPRSVKRYVNIYRILRARVPNDHMEQFLGKAGDPREFEAVILLIGIFATDAGFGRSFCASLYTQAPIEGVEDVILLTDALKEFAKGKSFQPSQGKVYNEISSYCERFENARVKAPIGAVARWYPVVSRFSFGDSLV